LNAHTRLNSRGHQSSARSRKRVAVARRRAASDCRPRAVRSGFLPRNPLKRKSGVAGRIAVNIAKLPALLRKAKN
jgi:hypothetical protein